MTDDTLFDSQNAAYVQAIFEEYTRNPDAVSAEWRELFREGKSKVVAEGLLAADQLDAPLLPGSSPKPTLSEEHIRAHEHLIRALPAVSRATALVQAFRDHGHQLARIDPLGGDPPGHPQLSPAFFGTSMDELSRLPASLVMDEAPEGQSVADALEGLRQVYAGVIGYEFEHLDDHVKVDWLWEQVEASSHFIEMSNKEKVDLLRRISEVEGLEPVSYTHLTLPTNREV